MITSPILDQDNFIAAVGIFLDLDLLAAMLAKVQTAQADCYIVDENGTVLASSVPQKVLKPFEMDHRLRGVKKLSSVYLVGQQIPSTDWTLSLTLPIHYVEKPVKSLSLITLLAAFATLAILALLILFVARSLSGRIQSLVPVMQALRDGDLTKRITVRHKDELGQISTYLNEVSEGLKRLISVTKEAMNRVNSVSQTIDDYTKEDEKQTSILQDSFLRMGDRMRNVASTFEEINACSKT